MNPSGDSPCDGGFWHFYLDSLPEDAPARSRGAPAVWGFGDGAMPVLCERFRVVWKGPAPHATKP